MTYPGFDPDRPADQPGGQYEAFPAQGGDQPPAGYGAEPLRFSASNAVSFGWQRFKGNPVPWVGVTALYGILLGVVTGGTGGFDTDADSAGAMTLGAVLTWLLTTLFWNVFTQAALAEVAGERPRLNRFTTLKNFGPFLIASIVLGVLGVIAQPLVGSGSVLLTLLGVVLAIASLVVAFLLQWSYLFIIDRDLSAVDAMKASMAVIRANLGPVLLLTITLAALNVIGALLCGLGLLITIPVAVIASAWAYRVLTGDGTYHPVSPAH
ncbi:hypothetical protein AB0H76_05420 [Nocardia sp. NPDC050712]|uniref:hypothetical protein n=1 Tax=Nocardia sp. NPDC050712 TaxID=3155518 RepID=UPI0033D9CCA4